MEITSKELAAMLISLSDNGLNYQEISKLINEAQTELCHHINKVVANNNKESTYKLVKSVKDGVINYYNVVD
jgi:hypothetical protein